MTQEEPRVTGKDWAKAFACSLLLLLLLCWWLLARPGGGMPGEGGGAGGSGNGPGSGSGSAQHGAGSSTEDSGSGRGGEAEKGLGDGASTLATANEATVPVGETPVAPAPPTATPAETPAATESPGTAAVPPTPKPPVAPVVTAPEVPETVEAPPPAVPGLERIATMIQPDAAPTRTPAASRPAGAKGLTGGAGKSVGGLVVRGSKLGVILDVSGSMQPYLEELRQEITNQFSDAAFLEVEGCSLKSSRPELSDRNQSLRELVMNAVKELVNEHGVDSIYWFCDLQDSRSDKALHELRELVWGKELSPDWLDESSNSLVRPSPPRPLARPVFHLYVRSTDEEPDEHLQRIIVESGGEFELRR